MLMTRTLIIITLAAAGIASAGTWHLEKDGSWKTESGAEKPVLLKSITRIKKLICEGKTDRVRTEYEKLKSEFPELNEREFDSFIEAELLMSGDKLTKAAQEYERFMKDYPQSDLYDAALEREFTIAEAFL